MQDFTKLSKWNDNHKDVLGLPSGPSAHTMARQTDGSGGPYLRGVSRMMDNERRAFVFVEP